MNALVLDGGGRRVVADPPVVLAPMAGVTNVPFRTLCRRYGGGIFVSEMVGARALIDAEEQGAIAAVQNEVADGRFDDVRPTGRERRLLRAAFGPDEEQRSIQLYATDPVHLRQGVAVLARHDLVDHIDLNFGCPAPKVTRHGGGAALPWRTGLFSELVTAAVESSGGRPVTVKVRKGIDDDHLTYLDAGRAARDAGAVAITLHGRTAEEAYAGLADWQSISSLVEAVGEDMAVLGNGDIWSAADALEMVRQTGCHGVVVGRGCLGRPWLFRDLQAAFTGQPVPPPPGLAEICGMLMEHGELLAAHMGELGGMRDIRKHINWYLQGFALGKPLRLALRQVETLAELRERLDGVTVPLEMPPEAMTMRRGHTHGPKPVRLPHGWLETREHRAPLSREADAVVSGG